MVIFKIIGVLVGSIIGLSIIILVIVKIMSLSADTGAKRKAKKYCKERGYKFNKIEAYPNHYGLFLEAEKMQIYSSFYYESDGTFNWKNGSPDEKIKARKEKKKQK